MGQHGVSMFKLKEDKEEQEQQCNTVVAPVSVSVREEEKGEEKSPRNNDDVSIAQVVISPKKEPTNQLKLKEDESNNNETSVLVLASASARILVVSASAMNIKNMRVSVLRAELAKRHLPNVGRKLELFNRLQQACLEEEAATTDTDTVASPIENEKHTSTDMAPIS